MIDIYTISVIYIIQLKISIISEGSCTKNSVLIRGINYILTYIHIENNTIFRSNKCSLG